MDNRQARLTNGVDLRATAVSGGAISLLLLLASVYGIQYFDQILLGLLVQPIKHELALSDTQVGLLTGLAFSLFYVFLGFPLARLADAFNRKRIIVISVLVFSAATASCGMVGGFLSLFIARICVAVGEAGTMPSAVSMLADSFRPVTRRFAMSIHSSGGFLGTALGLLAVSLFGRTGGWREIFWGAGAAGAVLAFVIILFGREPVRAERIVQRRSFIADMAVLGRNVPYVLITLGLGVGTIAASAAIQWTPAFLSRSYDLAQPKIVLFLSVAWGAGAFVGSIIFGYLTNALNRLGGHWPLIVCSALSLLSPFVYMAAFSVKVLLLSEIGVVGGLFLMSGIRGPAFATIQDIVRSDLQATANAGVMFSFYAIGVAFGPLFTGFISDVLAQYAGKESLRYALAVTMAIGGIGAAAAFAGAAVALKSLKST